MLILSILISFDIFSRILIWRYPPQEKTAVPMDRREAQIRSFFEQKIKVIEQKLKFTSALAHTNWLNADCPHCQKIPREGIYNYKE